MSPLLVSSVSEHIFVVEVSYVSQTATIEAVKAYLEQEVIDAAVLYPFADNYRKDGSIEWYNHKPVITARHALWEGVSSPESMADTLNALPRNPKSPGGYRLICVYAWQFI